MSLKISRDLIQNLEKQSSSNLDELPRFQFYHEIILVSMNFKLTKMFYQKKTVAIKRFDQELKAQTGIAKDQCKF